MPKPMPVNVRQPVYCPQCESENIHFDDDGCPCHCRSCGYEADCDECFDTQQVWSPEVGYMGTCGACAGDDVLIRDYIDRGWPLMG